MSRIIHYRYLSSYQTIFIIISIWIHNIPPIPPRIPGPSVRDCIGDSVQRDTEWAMADRSGIDEQLSHPNNESQATLILTTDLDLVSRKVKAEQE